MRHFMRAGCLLLVGAVALGVLLAGRAGLDRSPVRGVAPSPRRVAAWMPTSWDADRALASWEANRQLIAELSPIWYQLDASGDGSINPYTGACDAGLVDQAHEGGTLVLPLIHNYYGSAGFDAAPVAAVIHDPARRAAHIAVLVAETLACNTDGIDIDYESLNGEADRDAFSLFMEELAAALHAEGRILSVAVHPKTAEPGGWSGPQAQDWARIGAAVDRFRVMTYGYSWRTSGPGPIAPLFWMESVLAFAVSLVPPQRVYAGVHFYGLDWAEGGATALIWESAQALMAEHGATRQWEATDDLEPPRPVAEPWFAYTVDLAEHQAWYADGESVAARFYLVERYGLGGIAVWRLGGEDPAIWAAVADALELTQKLYLPLLPRDG